VKLQQGNINQKAVILMSHLYTPVDSAQVLSFISAKILNLEFKRAFKWLQFGFIPGAASPGELELFSRLLVRNKLQLTWSRLNALTRTPLTRAPLQNASGGE